MVTSYLLRLVLYFAIFLSSSTVSQAISLKPIHFSGATGAIMMNTPPFCKRVFVSRKDTFLRRRLFVPAKPYGNCVLVCIT